MKYLTSKNVVIDMSLIFKKGLIKCQSHLVRGLCTTGYERLDNLLFADEAKESDSDLKADDSKQNRARSIKVYKHFSDEPQLSELKPYIPSKYFFLKRRLTLKHLYLLDKQIAKSVVARILPFLLNNKTQVVCDTNAGLGLIAAELLDNKIDFVQVYESCNEFREKLKDFNRLYPKRVGLFDNDLFSLGLISRTDKYDYGNRVGHLLRGVPKRNWSDGSSMSIVGPMPDTSFIHYLIRMLTLQQEIITHGRPQIFALMKPRDYIKLTATPAMNLRVYQVMSILFQLFFEAELLEKYPRKSFLPWETKSKLGSRIPELLNTDLDFIYLVKMNFKTVLPIGPEHLLHLYYFIKQGFLRGRPKVIPTVEKWVPGIGVNLIVPRKERRSRCFPDMSIYTEFGQLSPTQILHVFLEMLEHPHYKSSPFVAIVESQLLKTETIESDLAVKNMTNESREVKSLNDKIT